MCVPLPQTDQISPEAGQYLGNTDSDQSQQPHNHHGKSHQRECELFTHVFRVRVAYPAQLQQGELWNDCWCVCHCTYKYEDKTIRTKNPILTLLQCLSSWVQTLNRGEKYTSVAIIDFYTTRTLQFYRLIQYHLQVIKGSLAVRAD